MLLPLARSLRVEAFCPSKDRGRFDASARARRMISPRLKLGRSPASILRMPSRDMPRTASLAEAAPFACLAESTSEVLQLLLVRAARRRASWAPCSGGGRSEQSPSAISRGELPVVEDKSHHDQRRSFRVRLRYSMGERRHVRPVGSQWRARPCSEPRRCVSLNARSLLHGLAVEAHGMQIGVVGG